MRFIIVAAAVAVMVASFVPQRGEAADVGPPPVYGYTPPPPPVVVPVVPPPRVVVPVEPRCEPVWRCGAYGCGWTRVCAGAIYARPYRGPRPYDFYD